MTKNSTMRMRQTRSYQARPYQARAGLTALLLLSAIAATTGCVGRSQPDHGPMGSTATGSDADLPDRNSQSLPTDRP